MTPVGNERNHMDFEIAADVWKGINASTNDELRDDLVELAIRYARLRVDHFRAQTDARIRIDEERTLCHNSFMGSCDILCRNMAKRGENTGWRDLLGHNRKEIGDFACYLHALLGISAR